MKSLKTAALGYVATRVLRKVLPRALPGGVVAIVAAEVVRRTLKARSEKQHSSANKVHTRSSLKKKTS